MTEGQRAQAWCETKPKHRIHSTRLKDKLLAPYHVYKHTTKDVSCLLVFDDDTGQVLADAYQRDSDSDAMCIAQAAQIVRWDLFDEKETFSGTFSSDCQERSVSTSLLTLVNMILEGPNIKDQKAHPTNQAALSIAQLLKFKSVKRK